jgi:TetR/AcrR family transcriptional regulator
VRKRRATAGRTLTIPAPSKREQARYTRAQILQAAERRFAILGFADTRLEDVGEEVGIGRSAVLYHFRDKRHLYRAVLDDVFGGFIGAVQTPLTGPGTLPERIEAAVTASIDYGRRRPTAAHIALREAATANSEFRERIRRRTGPAMQLVQDLFDEGRRSGVLDPIRSDAFHFVSAIAGATMFYIAALPTFTADLPYDPLAPEQFEAHKRDVLQIARRLLGIGGLHLLRSGRSKRARPSRRRATTTT